MWQGSLRVSASLSSRLSSSLSCLALSAPPPLPSACVPSPLVLLRESVSHSRLFGTQCCLLTVVAISPFSTVCACASWGPEVVFLRESPSPPPSPHLRARAALVVVAVLPAVAPVAARRRRARHRLPPVVPPAVVRAAVVRAVVAPSAASASRRAVPVAVARRTRRRWWTTQRRTAGRVALCAARRVAALRRRTAGGGARRPLWAGEGDLEGGRLALAVEPVALRGLHRVVRRMRVVELHEAEEELAAVLALLGKHADRLVALPLKAPKDVSDLSFGRVRRQPLHIEGRRGVVRQRRRLVRRWPPVAVVVSALVSRVGGLPREALAASWSAAVRGRGAHVA
mmetsp:Transcript_6398/g.20501  ORF Transcript_6398/g.20501 Transcript_6398/m.20501 type:complete len:341 (+) Transcript_6398:457-1479(+)